MSELISGKEALIALANNEVVQVRFKDTTWKDLRLTSKFDLSNFSNLDNYEFRLKPQTIMIGDVEVPAPFEPKEVEEYWHIDVDFDKGYCCKEYISKSAIQFGAWRTEEEIKQVVAALRKLFKGATQ